MYDKHRLVPGSQIIENRNEYDILNMIEKRNDLKSTGISEWLLYE